MLGADVIPNPIHEPVCFKKQKSKNSSKLNQSQISELKTTFGTNHNAKKL